MTHPAVTIQVNPTSAPSTPSWMGEVAAVAHVLTHVGLLKAIQDHVQFARARFGEYDTIDFVVDCRESVDSDSFTWATTIRYATGDAPLAHL